LEVSPPRLEEPARDLGARQHANKLISHSSATQQDFEAAVIQLQRAIEHRDRLLDQIYGFEKIPGKKGLNKYEVMADLEIIRPD